MASQLADAVVAGFVDSMNPMNTMIAQMAGNAVSKGSLEIQSLKAELALKIGKDLQNVEDMDPKVKETLDKILSKVAAV